MTIDSVTELILQNRNLFLHIACVKYLSYSHFTNFEGFLEMSFISGFSDHLQFYSKHILSQFSVHIFGIEL